MLFQIKANILLGYVKDMEAWKTQSNPFALRPKPQLGGCAKFWLLHFETGAIQSEGVQMRAAGLIKGQKNPTCKMV